MREISMNNASSALKVAAGIFLTIALITIVVILFISAQEATKTAQNNFSDIQTELSQAAFTVYDGTTISGSQVTNALRKYKDKDQFGVFIATGKNKAGQWYGNVLEKDGSILNPDSRQGNIDFVMDDSNVIRGIKFDQ
jgi:hypothetical protein